MITRFFRRAHVFIRDLPGNPYGHRAALRLELTKANNDLFDESFRRKLAEGSVAHEKRQHRQTADKAAWDAKLLEGYRKLTVLNKAEIAALDQANDAFMAEREELKATIAGRDVILSDLIGAYKEAEAEVEALKAALAEAKGFVAQHEGVTIPTVQAAEAELKACGITIAQTEGPDGPAPKVMVNSGVLGVCIRGRRVGLGSAPQGLSIDEASAANYLDVTARLSA